MHRIFPSAPFFYDGLYRQRGSLYPAGGAVEVCEVYCGVFLYHIGIFSLSYDTETSGDDHAGIYHAKDNPSVAGAGVFDHDLGGVFGKSIYASFVDLLFLQSSGLATDWQGLNWYVSAFFVVEIFYFVLYKCFRNSAKMKLLICMLIYFGYEININAMDGGFGRKMFHGIINLGMARAVAGIGLGYLFAIEWANFTATWKKQKQVQERTGGIEVWLIRVLEILTLSMLLIDFFCSSKAYDNQFIVIILFPVFFACLLTRRGVFSKLTDHKMIGLPGRYAYSIYVMQEAVFAVLKRTLWKNTVFLHDYPVPALTVSILVTIMAGIGTYHLVERPATKVLKKRLQVYI